VRRSYQQRLMISTQGAFSARLDAESFLITPRGVDRSRLDVHDIVLVTHGATELRKTPSSATVNHGAIYARHAQIQAIVTAYPVNATAFSVTDAALDTRTIPESYIFLRTVSRAPYGVQFADGRQLAELTSPRSPILLLENDGVQVCGTSVLDSFDRLEVLEATAEAMINSRPLGEMAPMSDETIRQLDKAFLPDD
jgi:L-fuculose-phosphate aldolase